MGWTGGHCEDHSALGLIEFEVGREFRERVLAACKKAGVIYAAVRDYKNPDEVFALVLLVERRNGVTYTKAMCDTEGPGYYDCPPRILDLLTPTTHDYAVNWRNECRKQAARPRPRKGQRVKFAKPIAFTDGKKRSTLIFEGRSRFRTADGKVVRVTRWQDREHTLA